MAKKKSRPNLQRGRGTLSVGEFRKRAKPLVDKTKGPTKTDRGERIVDLRIHHQLGGLIDRVGLNVATKALEKDRDRPWLSECRAFTVMYNASDVKRLCGAKFVVSFGHIRTLVRVKDRKNRRILEDGTIKEAWPVSRLRAEKTKLVGKQGQGGRRVKPPKDAAEALRRLVENADLWIQHAAHLTGPLTSEKPGSVKGKEIKKRVAVAVAKLKELAKAANKTRRELEDFAAK